MHVVRIETEQARILIETYHYSKNLPANMRYCFGSFDDKWQLEAVACYASCVSRKAPTDFLELRRLVKVPNSTLSLSQFLSFTIRELKKLKIPALLSWADPEQNHHGGIYQATNWVYTEQKSGGNHTFINENGKHIHPRTVYSMFGTQSVPKVLALNPNWKSFLPKTKHRYLMPLNLRKDKCLALLNTKEMPYPKPDAARPLDETVPTVASMVQPHGAAPNLETNNNMPTETTFTLLPDGSLPTQQIVEELYRLTEEYSLETYPSKHREHLGASVIGEKCRRKLFYMFRWVKLGQAEGRMRRLWQRGHREEEIIDKLLHWMGFFVREIDPHTDKQYKFSAVNGHFGGSGDGIALLPWFRTEDQRILLEKKTHNKKSFDALKNLGVAKAHPKHKDQMDSYGKAFKLRYGLYIAVCKDNDAIHYELVELNWQNAQELENKAADIINAALPPEKISSDPNYFDCKWCDFNDVCHWGEVVEKNCRSCKMSKAVEGGKWFCNRFNGEIPNDFIAKGCDMHQSVNE